MLTAHINSTNHHIFMKTNVSLKCGRMEAGLAKLKYKTEYSKSALIWFLVQWHSTSVCEMGEVCVHWGREQIHNPIFCCFRSQQLISIELLKQKITIRFYCICIASWRAKPYFPFTVLARLAKALMPLILFWSTRSPSKENLHGIWTSVSWVRVI